MNMKHKECLMGIATGVLAVGGYRLYTTKQAKKAVDLKTTVTEKDSYTLGYMESMTDTGKTLVLASTDDGTDVYCFKINRGEGEETFAACAKYCTIVKTKEVTDRVEIMDAFNARGELALQKIIIFVTEGNMMIDDLFVLEAGTKYLGGCLRKSLMNRLGKLSTKALRKVQIGDMVLFTRKPKIWPFFTMFYTNKWCSPNYTRRQM